MSRGDENEDESQAVSRCQGQIREVFVDEKDVSAAWDEALLLVAGCGKRRPRIR
jgi:hypothetical protein